MTNFSTSGKCWTYNLTDDTFTVSQNYGITKIAIKAIAANTSDGTVLGTLTIGGLDSVAIVLKAGESQTWDNGSTAIEGLVITSPDANCTLQLMVSQQ